MKQQDIMELIIDKILSEKLIANQKLPTENEMAEQYETSRLTIRKALEKLYYYGYLVKAQGSGWYINPNPIYRSIHKVPLSQRRKNVHSQVLLFENLDNIDVDVLKTFNETNGFIKYHLTSRFFHFKRIRFVGEELFSYEETYMPDRLFPDFSRSDVEGSVFNYIEGKIKSRLNHDDDMVTFGELPEEICELLKEPKNTKGIRHRHVLYDISGNVMQVTISYIKGQNNLVITRII